MFGTHWLWTCPWFYLGKERGFGLIIHFGKSIKNKFIECFPRGCFILCFGIFMRRCNVRRAFDRCYYIYDAYQLWLSNQIILWYKAKQYIRSDFLQVQIYIFWFENDLKNPVMFHYFINNIHKVMFVLNNSTFVPRYRV